MNLVSATVHPIGHVSACGDFGWACAGLLGLFGEDRPWEEVMPTTYLFGELATASTSSRFANLTFSLLIPRP